MSAVLSLPISLAKEMAEELLAKVARGSEILPLLEQGFDTSMIDSLLALGFERPEVYSTVIPGRTLQHRRSRKERLSVEESDRIVRLLRVLAFAEQVYGSRERALRWLRTPKAQLDPALNGQLFAEGGPIPMTLLTTETGARMVEQLLGQISEGMFI
jgi:putative toxin-antitoxin system antitoxin component (TIGR02293 family)